MPGDKSISHRAVLFAALGEGVSHITNVAPGADVASSMACVAGLGSEVVRDGLDVTIRGDADHPRYHAVGQIARRAFGMGVTRLDPVIGANVDITLDIALK